MKPNREIIFQSIFKVLGIILLVFSLYTYNTIALEKESPTKMNRLKNEKSPYLLQHADNPVDWYPWGDEAFEKAKKEDKPIFLSIGYSTCHWCHVMEHESYDDEDVAKLMNDAFVSIKVDREERPDIDNIYMTVCQMLSKGGCGWPLNIIMTPDKKPFFAATYIPKESRYGRAGMIEIIPKIKHIWENQRTEVLKSADTITSSLMKATDTSNLSSGKELDQSTLVTAFNQLSNRYDSIHGGFGRAPKFPMPHNLLFLLRYWNRSGDEEALKMVEETLEEMRRGGIYDQVGFGFHRYSTDPEWLVPHFEKMLYDQGLISMVYTEAYQATGKKEYKNTAEEIFIYVLRDMTSPEGAFYSAEDADSEGVEGKFYLWREEEIREHLDKEDADLFITVYNVEKNGNFNDESSEGKTGSNILHLKMPLSEIASSFKTPQDELEERLDKSRKKLFEIRGKRIHPYKDDKILTDWNGLMIASLAKASRVFDQKKYAEAAKKSADFFISNMMDKDGNLLHRYRDGDAAIQANIDDYAFFIWGLIDLYEATFDEKYLTLAIDLGNIMIDKFWDEGGGGFYFTPDSGEQLIARQKEIYDGAVPSGNSVAMLDLIRLARLTANTKFEETASKIGEAFSNTVSKSPIAYTQMMSALDFGVGPSYEVVIVGDPNSVETKKMIKKLFSEFVPNKVIIFVDSEEENPKIKEIAQFTKTHIPINNKPTAYVCRNFICNLPTNDSNKMVELLKQTKMPN